MIYVLNGGGDGVDLYRVKLPTSSWSYVADEEAPAYSQNKWLFQKYIKGAATPTLSYFTGKTPADTRLINDSAITENGSYGDNYTALCTIYCYSNTNFSKTFTITTDDGGAVYNNGRRYATLVSCQPKSVTIDFVKGQNKFQICYTEGTGEDGWVTNPRVSSLTEFFYCGAYPVGYHKQTVNVTPFTSSTPPLSSTSQILGFVPDVISSKTIYDNSVIKDSCQDMIIVPSANGQVTFNKPFDPFSDTIVGTLFAVTPKTIPTV